MQRKHTLILTGALLATGLIAGCASLPSPAELDAQAAVMIKSSFRDQGIAKVDRLNQDLGQAACSSDKPPADDMARRVEAEAMATIRPPADGKYLGDWREGEKLAQNGRGMTWTDASAAPAANGAQCYNCHQIGKEEISFGTIGPSLYNYGKLRGVKDVADPASAPIVQYTWGKLWNSKAYSACSNMPRFGHAKLLDEQQLKHLMALLLDPKSPVNQ
ncbi:sulfur oxidation c-type cytochrome SoxX [Caenimonas koreensis]|uniref:Sulfur oxidation c-type cytochrome SoxX n=1 Tax=Caenimonas koreensis DSM 17982 TaxID=1121255 RepID=A0A844AZD1_9BURK|nr:sulfur oxidation c-type cytochrome SoxX [Caenimonas koreensis]MRD46412.1 sulfur oxidation c-type cytochrome SoxX [Caenimonas koreensis DSM 17982]